MINHNYLHRYCSKCGVPVDDRCKTEFCHNCLDRSGPANAFYGRKHTVHTRKRMKISANKRDNSTRYVIPITPRIIKKRENTKRENWNKLTTLEKHKKLRKFIGAGSKLKSKTSIEEKVHSIIKSLTFSFPIHYKRNVQIGGYNVDFLINKKYIIECYGDYWHKNPAYYNDEADLAKRQKDSDKKQYLERRGLKFIYFWETDIEKNIKKVTLNIRKFLSLAPMYGECR